MTTTENTCDHCQNQHTVVDESATDAVSVDVPLEVPYKKRGKIVSFYSNRMEFNGNCLSYDDIEILTTECVRVTIDTFFGMPWGRDFQGSFKFKMKDGKKYRMHLTSMDFFGIGTARRNEKIYYSLVNPIFSIVAKHMSEKLIRRIQEGDTVEIAGRIITSTGASSTSKILKRAVSITKDNYREWQFGNDNSVLIYAKSGDLLWSSNFWYDNIFLIPYILDVIFI